jgi:hypothetical protein
MPKKQMTTTIERGDLVLVKNDRIGRETHYVLNVELLCCE